MFQAPAVLPSWRSGRNYSRIWLLVLPTASRLSAFKAADPCLCRRYHLGMFERAALRPVGIINGVAAFLAGAPWRRCSQAPPEAPPWLAPTLAGRCLSRPCARRRTIQAANLPLRTNLTGQSLSYSATIVVGVMPSGLCTMSLTHCKVGCVGGSCGLSATLGSLILSARFLVLAPNPLAPVSQRPTSAHCHAALAHWLACRAAGLRLCVSLRARLHGP